MKVVDIMTPNPVCCHPDTSIVDAARMMSGTDCGELPVVESRDSMRLVGVITDRDIVCRVVAEEMNPSATTVGDAMTGGVISCTAESDLDDCIDKMEEHQIRRVPVVDDHGHCCGIVSQADIALTAHTGQTAELVQDISRPA